MLFNPLKINWSIRIMDTTDSEVHELSHLSVCVAFFLKDNGEKG